MKQVFFAASMLFVLLFGCFATPINAQTTSIRIGNSRTTTNQLPFNIIYNDAYTQMIYTHEEVGDATHIGAIAFDIVNSRDNIIDELTIWMGHSTTTTIGDDSWVAAENLYQVFHATNFVIPGDTTTLRIVLDSMFYYNGTDDLAICISQHGADFNRDTKVRYSRTTPSVCIIRGADNSPSYHEHPNSLAGELCGERPNIVLTKSDVGIFCFPIENLEATYTNETQIDIAWTPAIDNATYEMAILNTTIDGNDLNSAAIIATSNSYHSFTGLTPNTLYKIGVRNQCTNGSYSEWNELTIRTTPIPTELPFICDFETPETRAQWILDDGEQVNHWVIDELYVDEDFDLYITDGTTLHPYNYNRSQKSNAFAKCLLRFDELGEYNIKYDWRSKGEDRRDYLRAMLVPASMVDTINSGNTIHSDFTTNTLPTGFIPLDNGSKLNLSDSLNHEIQVIDIPEIGNYYLTFLWINDGSMGDNPPAAIDNIIVERATCPGIDNILISDVTANEVTINAFSESGAMFQLCYRAVGSTLFDTLEVSCPYTLTGLTDGTSYEAIMTTICGSEMSYAKRYFEFQTTCSTIALPWSYGAEGGFDQHESGNEKFPYCWETLNGATTSYYWTKTAAPSEVYRGNQALKLNGSYWSATYNEWLFTPMINFEQGAEITMWVKAESAWGSATSRFAIYASTEGLTTIDDTTAYTPLTITAVNSNNNSIVRNNQITFSNTNWKKIKITLPNTLIGEHHLAFVVKGDDCDPFEIDDIYMYTPSSCPMPENIKITALNATSVTLNWESDAPSFMVYYGEPGFNMAQAATITVTDTMAELINLIPNYDYEYKIVAICSDGVPSNPTEPQSFTTACSPLANDALPLKENFSDNETGFTASLDPCWFKGTNDDTQYPYVEIFQSDKSLFMCSESNIYSYVALPAFEEDVSNLVLSCSIYRQTERNYHVFKSQIVIGLLKNPTDINTFTPFDTLNPANIGEWNDFQVSLSQFDPIAGQYIAFVMPAGEEEEAYLDNIKVELAGGCTVPTNLVLDNISHNEITLSWTDDESSSWMIYYGEPGFDIDTVSFPIMANGNSSATISGLTTQTTYEVCVVANCGDGNHSIESMRLRFITPCAPITTLPYTEDFESYETGDYATIDPCWVKHVVGPGREYPFPSTSAMISGTQGLYFKAFQNNSTQYNSYAALPMFEEAINNLQIKFKTKSMLSVSYNTIGYSKMAVGVMADPHDISTFDTVAIIDMTNLPSRTVIEHSIMLDEYLGDGQFIAFMALDVEQGNMNYAENTIYLDDVEVSAIPPCHRPKNLSYTSTTTTADLTWTGNANNYEVQYSTNEDMSNSLVETTNTNNIQLIGLTPETFYYVNVRGICSDIDSSEWMLNPAKIRTMKDCGDGFTNILDTIGDGPQDENRYSLNANSSNKDTRTWVIFTEEELNAMGLISDNNLIHSIMLHTTDAGSDVPFRMYMAETSVSKFNSSLSDTIDLNQMTLVYDGTTQFSENSWNEITLTTPFRYRDSANLMIAFERNAELTTSTKFTYTTGTEYRTAMMYKYNYSDNYNDGIYNRRSNIIFNICAEVPNCIRPLQIVVSNITDSSADLSWRGSANEYELLYDTEAFLPDEPNTANSLILNETQTTLQPLRSNSTYTLYIRSLCGDDSSAWSGPITITTNCGAISLPFHEDFDNYTADRNNYTMNPCWKVHDNGTGSTGRYPNISNTYAASAPNSFEFNSTPSAWSYAVMPITNDPITDITLTFKLHKMTPEYGTLYIGVMDDPDDKNTFQHVATAKPQSVETWEEFEISLATYEGDGKYIAFLSPDSIFSYVRMDDLEVFRTASCQAPINVTIADSSITENSAIVSWTDRTAHPTNGYTIEYGPKGFTLGTGLRITSNANPTTLSGLNHSECYDVYVRANCSNTDSSRWSVVTSFCTPCVPVELPIVYNFNDAQVGDDVPLPYCFNRYNDATDPTNTLYPYINHVLIHTYDETNYLYFSMGTNQGQANNEAMIFPAIDTITYPMNNNQMVFWAKRDYHPAEISVGIMSDPNDITTYVAVDTLELTNEYEEYTITFNNYTGNGIYPTILAYHNPNSYSAYIDDITLEVIPTCPRAKKLRAYDITHNTATIDWEQSIPSTQWLIEYNIKGSDNLQTLITTNKPYTLTNLAEFEEYEFNVRPICSVGDTATPAVSIGRFKTLLEPATLPYVCDFEDANEWRKWQTNTNTSYVNWYNGTAVAGQGTKSMYVSSNQGDSCTTDWQNTINTVAYRDIDFGPDTSTFTISFMALVGGSIDDFEYAGDEIQDEFAVMIVDPHMKVDSSDQVGVSPWGSPDTLALATLRHNTIWSTFSYTIDNVAGLQRVAFYWYNNFTDILGCTHTEMSCAIDSITITEHTCSRPHNIIVTNAGHDDISLTWRSNAPKHEVEFYPYRETHVPRFLTVLGNTTTLDGLAENTDYRIRIRAICSDNDTSIWSEPIYCSTNCGLISAAQGIHENFDNIMGTQYATNGHLPRCWDAYSNSTNEVRPHVVDNGEYWYSHEGNSLVMTGGGMFGDTAIVRLPYTIEPVNTLSLSYWMCTESASAGTLQIGYLTSPDMANDFIIVDSVPASYLTKHHSIAGVQNDSTGYWDTVAFDQVPTTAQAVALRWIYNGSSNRSVSIDNLELRTDLLCAIPFITHTTSDYESITLQWNGGAIAYQVMIKLAGTEDWGDTIITAATHYTFTNLQPDTRYTIQLRSMCGDLNSAWIETEYSTEDLVCNTPTNPTLIETGYDHIKLSWEANSPAHKWVVNTFNTLDNKFDTVNSNPAIIANLYDNTEYHVAMKNLCTEYVSSDWSDTLTFTTKTCPSVSNVIASEITANSAVITWVSPDANKWQINYGLDIAQDAGEYVTANETSYRLTDLESETPYDVYVRSYCTDHTFGRWSDKITFTTLVENGIDGIKDDFQFRIYPNPTHGNITITLNGVEGNISISIVDMNGRTITTENIECGVDCEKRLDVAGLAQGTYFVRVLGNNINSIRKLIVK